MSSLDSLERTEIPAYDCPSPDVGRSCILVSIGGKNIMLDCGMHMGYNDEVYRLCGFNQALFLRAISSDLVVKSNNISPKAPATLHNMQHH